MRTKTDITDLIRLICTRYNDGREILHYSHKKALHEVELMYDNLYEWIYNEELKK